MQGEIGIEFGDPIRVNTKRGPRILRKASPNAAFWVVWNDNENKRKLKEYGYSVTKDRGGAWVVCHWAEIGEVDAATVAQSRATDAEIEIPVPAGLSYLPFQRAGIAFAASRKACLIADEMGLGKTVMTCGLINLIEPNSRVLVVCPASLKINWEREASRWLVNNLTIGIATASEWPDSQLVIVNYDVLGRHQDEIDIEWDLVVFDEAHYLKNPRAKRTKLGLSIRAKRKLMLTGTPAINRPVELQPLVGYLHPEFSDFWSFAKRYCDAKKNRWGWDIGGVSHPEELQERLRGTVMIRRLKEDVLPELPPKRRQVIVVPATGGMKSALAEETKELKTLAEAVDSTSTVEILFEQMSATRHTMAMAKVDTIVDMVKQVEQPIVVFAHHRSVISAIECGLSSAGRSVVTLTGDDSAEERQAAVEAFQNGLADVFIGSISAAGVGITLTRASHILFAELCWTGSGMNQCEDRCHRIGQVSSVLIQTVVVDKSIDARILELIVGKQSVLDAVLDDHSPTAKEQAPVAPVVATINVNDLISQVVSTPPADGIDLSSLPAGRYAVPGGDTRLKVKISKPEDGRWAGFVFVSDAAEYGSGKRYGTQHPGEGDMYQGQIQDALKEIMKDPLAASMAYGLLTETCGVCGRTLEDPQSVARGIGPICASRF